MLKEFKEFAMRGNVLDMAVGIIVGGAFGKRGVDGARDRFVEDRQLLCGRYSDAAPRVSAGKGGFRQPVSQSFGRRLRFPGRGEESRCRHAQLWSVHQHRPGLSDSGVCGLLADQAGQPAQEDGAKARGGSRDKRLHILLLEHPDQGHTVPALHLRAESRVTSFTAEARRWFRVPRAPLWLRTFRGDFSGDQAPRLNGSKNHQSATGRYAVGA